MVEPAARDADAPPEAPAPRAAGTAARSKGAGHRLPRPIFLLGIHQRSGTNFLFNLLSLHPGCQPARVIMEDFLLSEAHLLRAYAERTYRRWNPRWRVGEQVGPPEALCRHLGDGLVAFLYSQLETGYPRRMLTKTPTVRNLDLFARFFPEADLVIIVRDGRSLIESGVRSFGWRYEQAMRAYVSGARAIERVRASAASPRVRVIRYEDLHEDPEGQLRGLLPALGLDPSVYDFEAARRLPVSGSSDLRRNGAEEVHWKPVEKTEDFSPLRRWEGWSRSRHERYNWLAGREHTGLGYELRTYPGARLPWTLRNRLLDAGWGLRRGAVRVRDTLRCARDGWRNEEPPPRIRRS